MKSPVIAVELRQLVTWLLASLLFGIVTGLAVPLLIPEPGHPAPLRHVVFQDGGR